MDYVETRFFRVASCTYGQLLSALDAWRKDGGRHFACFCDANGLAFCKYDSALMDAYRRADAVLADGSVTKALAWVYGGRLPERGVRRSERLVHRCQCGLRRGVLVRRGLPGGGAVHADNLFLPGQDKAPQSPVRRHVRPAAGPVLRPVPHGGGDREHAAFQQRLAFHNRAAVHVPL